MRCITPRWRRNGLEGAARSRGGERRGGRLELWLLGTCFKRCIALGRRLVPGTRRLRGCCACAAAAAVLCYDIAGFLKQQVTLLSPALIAHNTMCARVKRNTVCPRPVRLCPPGGAIPKAQKLLPPPPAKPRASVRLPGWETCRRPRNRFAHQLLDHDRAWHYARKTKRTQRKTCERVAGEGGGRGGGAGGRRRGRESIKIRSRAVPLSGTTSLSC